MVRFAVFVHDLLAAGAAVLLALAARLGLEPLDQFAISCLLFVLVSAGTNVAMGLNSGIWRYASLADMIAIVKSSAITVLFFTIALFLANRLDAFPRTSLLLSLPLLIVFLGAGRVAYRLYRTMYLRRRSSKDRDPENVLVVGVGPHSENFIKAVSDRTDLNYRVVGVIDPRGRRVGFSIRGIKVLGGVESIGGVLELMSMRDKPVKGIVLTKDSLGANTAVFDAVSAVARLHQVQLLHLLPAIGEMEADTPSKLVQPRPIVLEDLLPRRQVVLDREPLVNLVKGLTVLVTGAGGSIGSELCRQLIALEPKRIVLVDASEFLLYEIETELRQLKSQTEIVPRLGNVRNRKRIFRLFAEFQPEIIYHAAALKHVPIVEGQPLEGLETNVMGTINVADAALSVDARAMLLISTDKAINPTNVMGASKRIAELYCQSLDVAGGTRFLTVRFGNVLGSAGSVVPLFEKQIRMGGPVTVTHPEIERYFMTIPEAVQLVLHASCLGVNTGQGDRGRIYVLEMGQPVKIAEVARRMIQLAGHEPNVDIEIKYIGLRPGEKLFEELFDRSEPLVATNIDGLLSASPRVPIEVKVLMTSLRELEENIATGNLSGAMKVVRHLVPEYSAGGQLASDLGDLHRRRLERAAAASGAKRMEELG